MLQHWSPSALACVLCFVVLGCQSGKSTLSPPITDDSQGGMAAALAQAEFPISQGGGEWIVGLARLRINPWTQEIGVESIPVRQATLQGDTSTMDLGPFLIASSMSTDDLFDVTDATFTGTQVELEYTHEHPFAAPSDLEGAPSNANRADVGYTGRIVFLAELSDSTGASTFFTDGDVDVIANTTRMVDPDGYVQLEVPTLLIGEDEDNHPDADFGDANTFPYKLIVDEKLNNRISMSNGGSRTGDYNASSDRGWQQSNSIGGVLRRREKTMSPTRTTMSSRWKRRIALPQASPALLRIGTTTLQ